MARNIVLIGFMGVGKTLLSKELETILHKERVSTDEMVEKAQGKSIPEIFKESGEAHFRALEKDAVRDISKREDLIVDCGGGVVLDEGNMKGLKSNGVLFYLKATPKVILKNLQNHEDQNRPLLDVDDPQSKIKKLLTEREPYYSKADHTIDADGRPFDFVINDILRDYALHPS